MPVLLGNWQDSFFQFCPSHCCPLENTYVIFYIYVCVYTYILNHKSQKLHFSYNFSVKNSPCQLLLLFYWEKIYTLEIAYLQTTVLVLAHFIVCIYFSKKKKNRPAPFVNILSLWSNQVSQILPSALLQTFPECLLKYKNKF